MNYTENLHLLKPETTELFDVQHANSNAELIDTAVAAKASLEQVAAMLEQIIETGEITEVDVGVMTTIKEINHGTGLRIWIGTTAELNALPSKASNVLYLRTDGDDLTELEEELGDLEADVADIAADVTDLQTATADSDWQTISPYSGWTGTIKIRKIGSMVQLKLDVEYTSGTSLQICSISSAYKPATDEYALLPGAGSNLFNTMQIVTNGGFLMINHDPSTLEGVEIRGTITYLMG